MAIQRNPLLEARLPGLANSPYEITSPYDASYNCIAWAAGDNTQWWEPDPMETYYWPENVPRSYSLASYQAAFAFVGFMPTEAEEYTAEAIRIALFARGDRPMHAARQVSYLMWTSKFGKNIDMIHPLRSICGELYGDIALFMIKRLSTKPV